MKKSPFTHDHMLVTLDLDEKSQMTILVKDVSTWKEPICVSKSAIPTTERKANIPLQCEEAFLIFQ